MPKKSSSEKSKATELKLSSNDRSWRKLFWAARLAHGSARSPADGEACVEHINALDFGERLKWSWVNRLLTASINGLLGHLLEATQDLEAVEHSIPAQHRCLWLFLRASLAFLSKDHETAIKCCNEILKDPTFDRRGYALTNMGESHLAIKQLPQAIKCYRAALNEADYDSPAYALNNLGKLLLREKRDFKEAINVLRKAVGEKPEHVRSEGYFYLGSAYRESGDTTRAIECFRKALTLPAPNEWFQLNSARQLLELRRDNNPDFPLSSDDSSLLGWDGDPKSMNSVTISPEIRAAAKIFRAKETQYDKYMRQSPSTGDGKIYVLRGWSSAVTLIDGSQRRWRGGGYFIKWKGQGIVIDPGFDFLRNFHDAGFHASEIDAVIVSHNHPDHNDDLQSIDDLCYEVHKRRGNQSARPYQLLLDEDTRIAEPWTNEKRDHRFNSVSLDYGRCNPRGRFPAKGGDYVVEYFPVQHGEDVPHAVGFCLDLCENSERKIRIGFTGDTEFFKELPSHLSDCDILIAHISQPSVEELHNPAERKAVHLGYRGMIELIRLAKPRLTLIGEFWAGLEDLRIDLASGAREMSANVNVFPTSIGMTVNLENGKVVCSTCRMPISPEKVRVTAATELFGSLGYHCPACTLG